MEPKPPLVYLVRHGETECTLSGQHTGRSDIPLTPRGEDNGRRIGGRLAGLKFALVLVSPRQRARRTCELAGLGPAVVDNDLAEWDYGDYEGRTTAEIHRERPGWSLFRDGCPGGENAAAVGARADRVIARARQAPGNVALFAHGHILRVLGTRWVGLPPEDGRLFLLGTATVSILDFEHHCLDEPVIRLWNDDRHLAGS